MKSHAEILADIAKQVVEEHRRNIRYRVRPKPHNLPRKLNVPIPAPIDPSWDYTLPEEYQG